MDRAPHRKAPEAFKKRIYTLSESESASLFWARRLARTETAPFLITFFELAKNVIARSLGIGPDTFKLEVLLSIYGCATITLEVIHEGLKLGSKFADLFPVPGIKLAIDFLLQIWSQLEGVVEYTLPVGNFYEIGNAGENVVKELGVSIERFNESIGEIKGFVRDVLEKSPITKVLQRNAIQKRLKECDRNFVDACNLFLITISARNLKYNLEYKSANVPRAQSSDPNNSHFVVATALSEPTDTVLDRAARASKFGLKIPKQNYESQSQQEFDDDMADQFHLAARSVLEDDGMNGRSNHLEDLEVAKGLLTAFEDYKHWERRSSSVSNTMKHGRLTFDGDDIGENKSSVDSPRPPVDASKQAGKRGVNAQRSKTGLSQNSIQGGPAQWDDIDRAIEWLRRYLWRCQSSGQISIPSWAITQFDIAWGDYVGRGRFSDVFKGALRGRPDRSCVAIKRVYKMTFHEFGLFEREASIWETLQHPNVLELFGASYNSYGPVWFFVTPYYDKRNLATYLSGIPSLLNVDVLKMINEIADGMAYLHNRAILHGDLKAANVLVDSDLSCVISNFGHSERKFKVDRRRWVSNATAAPNIEPDAAEYSPKWLAPEQLAGQSVITQHIDVYAYAFTCVEILYKGDGPWPSADAATVRRFVHKEKCRPDIPRLQYHWILQLSEMLARCWDQDQNVRPPFSEINTLTKRMRVAEPGGSPEVAPGGVSALKDTDFLVLGVVVCSILVLAVPVISRVF
ncbi:kinase-like domain-containing protein [Trametes maxima]|nr:kinase-like domain-containing protein [Trametes maxima]